MENNMDMQEPMKEEIKVKDNSRLKKIADDMMQKEDRVWTKLNINSGSELYQNKYKQRDYFKLMRNSIDRFFGYYNFTKAEKKELESLFEDMNRHSMNNYIALKGFYTRKDQIDYINYHTKMPESFLNPANGQSSMSDGGEVEEGDTIRLKKDLPYMASLSNLYNKDLKVDNITETYFASGTKKYYHVTHDGDKYEVREDFVDNEIMAEGGEIYKQTIQLEPIYTKRDKQGFRFYSTEDGNTLYAEKDGKIHNVSKDSLKVLGEVPRLRAKVEFIGIINDEDTKNLYPLHYEYKTMGKVKKSFGMAEGGEIDKKITVIVYNNKILNYTNQDIQEIIDNIDMYMVSDNLPKWLIAIHRKGNPTFPKNKEQVLDLLKQILKFTNGNVFTNENVLIDVDDNKPAFKNKITFGNSLFFLKKVKLLKNSKLKIGDIVGNHAYGFDFKVLDIKPDYVLVKNIHTGKKKIFWKDSIQKPKLDENGNIQYVDENDYADGGETDNKITFSVDSLELDEMLHNSFDSQLEYNDENGDVLYTLPKRQFDRLIDMADSRGFDVDYENSEESVIIVYDNYAKGGQIALKDAKYTMSLAFDNAGFAKAFKDLKRLSNDVFLLQVSSYIKDNDTLQKIVKEFNETLKSNFVIDKNSFKKTFNGNEIKIENKTSMADGGRIDELGAFWVVEKPSKDASIDDILFKSRDVDYYANQIRGGLKEDNVVGLFRSEDKARKLAEKLLKNYKSMAEGGETEYNLIFIEKSDEELKGMNDDELFAYLDAKAAYMKQYKRPLSAYKAKNFAANATAVQYQKEGTSKLDENFPSIEKINKQAEVDYKEGLKKIVEKKSMALGGMTAGRWYKDNSGKEFRFIGESDGKLLFNDGEKVVKKSEDDFESDVKETKLFNWFKKGGVISEQKFDISDNKASEDIYKWIIDNFPEDIKISENESKKLRQSSIDEILHYFQQKLAFGRYHHKVESKGNKKSITLYITMKEWYEDDLLNKKYKKYFGEVPPIFKNMRLDWKRTYFIDAGLEKNEDTNVDNEDDPENDFGLDEDMRYKYDTDEDNDDRYPRYKKGGVISEQKFDISDNEASEDAYEWIMDNINEDIEIDEETDEQLRESEIDEVVRYFNGELENHRIETKESKNSMTLYVIKKMAKGGKTSVSPLKDGGEVEKPFKVKIIYYGAIEYNEELNLFAKNKEDAFEKASDSDEVKNKGYKIISVDEVKLLEFKKAKTKEDVKKILDELQIEKYIINDDLSVDVKGSVNIKNKNLIKIPVKFNKVSGTFDCENNFLTSLHGCPEKVGGWFLCKNNKLTNLHGGPKFVDIDYISSNNQLTSLEGSPEKVKGRFDCSNNQLTSLKGSPQFVGRDFDCSNNKLTSLEYAPKIIKGSIISYKNNIVDSPKKDTNDKKRVDDAIKKLGQNPSNYEVANFVYNNYNKVTGEKKSMRDEEMDFPTQIYDIIEHYKLDVDEFTQNYSKAAEGYEKGGKTSVSPLKDRIIGSKKNKIGTASSKTSAKDIELNDSIIEALSEKAKEYNEKHSNKVSTSTLKAVMRRGMGAFSSSHRPGMTRQGWGYARVNKFLLKKGGTKVKATYTQDDDLLENGGELKKIVRVSDKPKFKKLMELEDKAKDSMYRKSNRNNFQRWNETTGQNFANRWNKMVLELRGYNDTEGKGKGSAKAEWIEYCKEQGMVEDYNFGDVIA